MTSIKIQSTIFIDIPKYFYGDKIKEDEISGECDMAGEEQQYIWGNMKERATWKTWEKME
jgi:hypothetical protein